MRLQQENLCTPLLVIHFQIDKLNTVLQHKHFSGTKYKHF